MTSSLVDSNVLIDQMETQALHREWSAQALRDCALDGPLVINQIVYAEVAMYFSEKDALGLVMRGLVLARDELPWDAAHRAGLAHVEYRKAGGTRDRVLADFLIGAHAAVKGFRLITRDGARFRKYFPDLTIVAPDSHP